MYIYKKIFGAPNTNYICFYCFYKFLSEPKIINTRIIHFNYIKLLLFIIKIIHYKKKKKMCESQVELYLIIIWFHKSN